ncbi:MAG: alkaline phosphatase family protein [Chloroflexia bacterium]
MVRRLLRILLIPLLLLGLGIGAYQLANFSFDTFMEYPGPALGKPPVGRPTTPISRRVVVVVVDGLREDTSRQMPTFQRLREQGADLPSLTQVPSLSLPGYTVLGTGAYPDFSGVTTNWYQGAVRVDSLFARAREAGLPTALSTMGGWDELYGPWVTHIYTVTWSGEGHDPAAMAWTTPAIGREALRLLRESDVALLYVHFGETDEAGHAYGGTGPEYLQAARHVDEQIAAIAQALDWSRDTLILTADHGMSAAWGSAGGGHGGGEMEVRRIPLVLVGRGIAPGVYPQGGQADLVPTIAALLGLPIPVHSQGHTRLDALALTPQVQAEKALALGEQQEALYTAYLEGLGASLETDGLDAARAALSAGDYGQVEKEVRAYLDRLDEAVARAVANRLWQERLVRLPYFLVPLLGLALYVGLYRPRSELLRPFLLALLFFVLHLALYFLVRGYTISFTAIAGLSEKDFFFARMTDAFLVMVLVALVAGILWRRRPWEEVVWKANQSALFVAWVYLLQLGLFAWLFGPVMSWRLPDLTWGFKYYLDLLATVGAGLAGFLFPWLALGVSRIFLLADWVRRR